MNPTRDEIAAWLTEQGAPTDWADFLCGLGWDIIKPGVKMARASKVHPAVSLGAVAVYTGDQQIRGTIREHLARQAPTPETPAPNREQRRAAARGRRKR